MGISKHFFFLIFIYAHFLNAGSAPIVVARGGFSGIFPDSSLNAYKLAILTSLPTVVSWCDVQLTKDAVGICAPSLMLNNCSSIDAIAAFHGRSSTYDVNGVPTKGWFSIDFNVSELSEVIRESSFPKTPLVSYCIKFCMQG